MRPNYIRIPLVIIICLIIFPTVSAHVPLEPADNHSLDEAFEVHEPTKSWALYDHIHEGSEAAYYKFDLNPGERAYALVYTLEEGSFAPGLVIMGPGIMSNDTAPDYVEIVNDTGRAVAYGSRPAEAGYEPFTPSSYYYTAEFDQEVDVAGTYYVAVFENETGGKFGIAIGYIESFSASEWLGVPLDVIKIHLWEGQSIFLILAPLILIVIIGLILFYIFQKRTGKGPRLLSHRLGFLAGLIFFGTSAMILMQMLIALGRGPGGPLLWVTFVFAAIPITRDRHIAKLIHEAGSVQNARARLDDGVRGHRSDVLVGAVHRAGTSINSRDSAHKDAGERNGKT
jgi:hypothetical protein